MNEIIAAIKLFVYPALAGILVGILILIIDTIYYRITGRSKINF